MEKVEGVFKQCPAVEQLWVYGNSMESTLVAVVVPSTAHAKQWAEGQDSKPDASVEENKDTLHKGAAVPACPPLDPLLPLHVR